MCECLIYTKDHFMDDWTPEYLQERISVDPVQADNYLKRFQRGDYIEIRDDGYWTTPGTSPGYNKNAFELLILQGVSVEDAEHLVEPDVVDDEEVKRRRYSVDIDSIEARLINKVNRKSIPVSTMNEKTFDKKENKILSAKLEVSI